MYKCLCDYLVEVVVGLRDPPDPMSVVDHTPFFSCINIYSHYINTEDGKRVDWVNMCTFGHSGIWMFSNHGRNC